MCKKYQHCNDVCTWQLGVSGLQGVDCLNVARGWRLIERRTELLERFGWVGAKQKAQESKLIVICCLAKGEKKRKEFQRTES